MRQRSEKDYHAQMVTRAADAFAEHQIRERSDGRWLLERPGGEGKWHSDYWAEIIVLRAGKLLVHGDIEHVIFGHYSDTRDPLDIVRWMGRHEDPAYYVTQKALLGTGRELIEVTDDGVMERDLRRKYDERLAELREACDDPAFGDLGLLDRMDLEELVDSITDYAPQAVKLGVVLPHLTRGSRDETAWRSDLVRVLSELRTKIIDTWVAEHRDSDDRLQAWEEALDEFRSSGDRDLVLRQLHEAETADGHSVFNDCEEYCDLGRVTAPRVYFAHAAVRRLHLLLEAEKAQKTTERVA